MSITRNFLVGMGLTEEQQSSILEAHLETVNGLKTDIDRYKADAEKLPGVIKELDAMKAAGDGGLADLQARFAALEKEKKSLQKEYDTYKADQIAKETLAAKESAYRALLKELRVDRADTVVRAAYADGVIDAMKLDENGAAQNADALKESIRSGWADFILKESTGGVSVPTPPQTGTDAPKTTSRAAELYQKHYNALYGAQKGTGENK